MRRLILLLILALTAFPAVAAKRVTVAQLEERIKSAVAANRPDAEIARHVADLQLTERLTDVSLDRLTKELMPHHQAVLELQLLADQSAFLDPPPSEASAKAAPDATSQEQMLNAARSYAAQTLPRLPNFLATRTINRYDNSPQAAKKGDWGVRLGLHLVATSSHDISVSVERQNQPATESAAAWQQQIGLISGGEFGTTMGMVMTDTVQGKIAWSHWEQAAGNLVAVFQYSVPRSASHFQVIGYRERSDLVGLGSVTRGSAAPREGVLAGGPSNTTTVYTKPGYHGSFWVDPATGTILRITLETDSKDGTPFRSAGILVQYGPIQIGESRFICPTRSLAFSVAVPDPQALFSDAPTEWLNVTQFSGYHRFASTVRILTGTPKTQPTEPGGPSAEPQIASLTPNKTSFMLGETVVSTGLILSSFALASPAISALRKGNEVESTEASTDSVARKGNATEPGGSSAASVVPKTNEPHSVGPTVEVHVNRVLVPVVVRDKKGFTVDGLKKEDFNVFDNDKARPISGFLVEKRGGSDTGNSGDPGSKQPTNTPPELVLPKRIIVFLFDDMHLSMAGVAYARKAASKTLEALGPSDLAAVVTTSGKVNSGLTHDPAELHKGLIAVQPQEIYRTDAGDCPKIDYYQADLIVNKHDDVALQDAITQVVTVCDPKLPVNLAEKIVQTTAMRTLVLGSQDVRTTYAAISEFVRRIAKMPGQRMIILVSSGFLPIEQEARTLESELIDLAAQSDVTISAIDARGLYTASVTASDDVRKRDPNLVADYRRTSMSMAENSMGELAYGTGGMFFHNNNDLDAGFRSLTQAPEQVYVLELSLDDAEMDGKYHRLKVKLDRNGLDVNARRGYFVPKPEKNKK